MTGLLTHDEVRKMINREPEIKKFLRAWFSGKVSANQIAVAGPPTEEVRKRFQALSQTVPLPTVTLKLKRVKHNLTGEPGILIEVSEEDIEEIKRWNHDWLRNKN